jgi:hypothetical protein
MPGVRVLVGTKKGAFICTSDAGRSKWTVSPPLLAGWEIYHVKGSPLDPDLIYASQTDGWFGQIIQRSAADGAVTWKELPALREQKENCYHNVLREAMCVDQLDDCGIYFGTTGGQVYCSPDGGDHWNVVASDLPKVLSVEVQTLK